MATQAEHLMQEAESRVRKQITVRVQAIDAAGEHRELAHYVGVNDHELLCGKKLVLTSNVAIGRDVDCEGCKVAFDELVSDVADTLSASYWKTSTAGAVYATAPAKKPAKKKKPAPQPQLIDTADAKKKVGA